MSYEELIIMRARVRVIFQGGDRTGHHLPYMEVVAPF